MQRRDCGLLGSEVPFSHVQQGRILSQGAPFLGFLRVAGPRGHRPMVVCPASVDTVVFDLAEASAKAVIAPCAAFGDLRVGFLGLTTWSVCNCGHWRAASTFLRCFLGLDVVGLEELGTWEDLLIKFNTLPNLESGKVTEASVQVISGRVGTGAPTLPALLIPPHVLWTPQWSLRPSWLWTLRVCLFPSISLCIL